jgi:hypothetical protein
VKLKANREDALQQEGKGARVSGPPRSEWILAEAFLSIKGVTVEK